MSKEAMKLALEALENSRSLEPVDVQWVKGKRHAAITALREALAKPDFWEGYVPEPNSTCSNALRIQHKAYPRTCKKCGLGPCVELAQQALDKKAENARELGLDYEPAQQEPVDFASLLREAEELVREKPTWKRFIEGTPLSNDIAVWMTVFAQDVARRTSPPAQQEPVAWRYTDARGHYRYRGFVANFDKKYPMLKPQPLYTPPPAQRKPLTDEWIRSRCGQTWVFETAKQWIRLAEAAHGIKEQK